MGNRLWATGYGQQAMGNRLWAKVNSQQSIVYEQQSMSNSL